MDGETTTEYDTRFTGTVAKYVNLTNYLTAATSSQFAIVKLRNAKILNDTVNAVMYQITAMRGDSGGRLIAEIKVEPKEVKELNGSEYTVVHGKMKYYADLIRK